MVPPVAVGHPETMHAGGIGAGIADRARFDNAKQTQTPRILHHVDDTSADLQPKLTSPTQVFLTVDQ